MTTLRQRAAAITAPLRTAAAGACLTILYLNYTLDPAVPAIHRLYALIVPSFWALWILDSWLQPRPEPSASLPDLSPASSGAGVVLATGLAAALYLGRDFHRPDDLMIPAVILLASGAIAIAVVRFARRHPGEIGEARFDTRNPEQR